MSQGSDDLHHQYHQNLFQDQGGGDEGGGAIGSDFTGVLIGHIPSLLDGAIFSGQQPFTVQKVFLNTLANFVEYLKNFAAQLSLKNLSLSNLIQPPGIFQNVGMHGFIKLGK